MYTARARKHRPPRVASPGERATGGRTGRSHVASAATCCICCICCNMHLLQHVASVATCCNRCNMLYMQRERATGGRTGRSHVARCVARARLHGRGRCVMWRSRIPIGSMQSQVRPLRAVCAMSSSLCPSPGAEVAGVSPSPGADVAALVRWPDCARPRRSSGMPSGTPVDTDALSRRDIPHRHGIAPRRTRRATALPRRRRQRRSGSAAAADVVGPNPPAPVPAKTWLLSAGGPRMRRRRGGPPARAPAGMTRGCPRTLTRVQSCVRSTRIHA
jgi:hypothetical protein